MRMVIRYVLILILDFIDRVPSLVREGYAYVY